jgi:polysaccharide chain length determinant protein (PEP-CTERM system associated)
MSIQDYWRIAWRRKWSIIIPFFLISLASVVWSFLQPKIYRSTTLILVEPQKVPESYVKPTVATSVRDRLNTISQQIMSWTRLEKIIAEFQLYPEARARQAPQEEIIERMRKDIELKVKGKDSFTISYQGRDPQTVMRVTNELASLFIQENLKVREQQAEGTTQFLDNQLTKLKKRLEEQEKAVQNYKQRYMGELPQQLDANLRVLEQLQLQLQTNQEALKSAEERRFLLETQLAELGRQNIPITRDLLAGTAPPGGAMAPFNTLETLKNQLATLQAQYSDKYPDVIRLKKEIEKLEARLQGSPTSQGSNPDRQITSPSPYYTNLKTQIATLALEIGSLQAEKKRLQEQIGIYRAKVENTPKREQELTVLTRDYEITRQNYQSLLNKKLEAQLAEDLERRQKGEQFRILDPANLPQKPFKPNRKKLALIGIMLGLGAGLGLAFFQEYLDHSFWEVEDLKEYTQLPVLAVVPTINFPADKKESKWLIGHKSRKSA